MPQRAHSFPFLPEQQITLTSHLGTDTTSFPPCSLCIPSRSSTPRRAPSTGHPTSTPLGSNSPPHTTGALRSIQSLQPTPGTPACPSAFIIDRTGLAESKPRPAPSPPPASHHAGQHPEKLVRRPGPRRRTLPTLPPRRLPCQRAPPPQSLPRRHTDTIRLHRGR